VGLLHADTGPDAVLAAFHFGGAAHALGGQGGVGRSIELPAVGTLDPAALFDAEGRHRNPAAARRYDEAGDDNAVLLAAPQPLAFLQIERLVTLVFDQQLIDAFLILFADFHQIGLQPFVEGEKVAVIL